MAQSIKLNKATTAPLLAEFLGTSVLVLVALVLSQTTAVAYFIGTSVAVALGVAYMMFGGISGGHFNPAISLGVWASKKITQASTIKTVGYIVAQMLGGFASWKLYEYLVGRQLTTQSVHYTFPILLAEAVGTVVVALGFATAAYRAASAIESAFTYGLSLFVGVLIASTASAGFLNPAVALAERNFNWVYIVGPAAGSVVALNVYRYLFAPAPTGVKAVVAKVVKAKKTAARRRK